MYIFFYYFLLFFIYSVLGWIIETINVSFTEQKFVNRGFLIGPYCPIYGWGAIFMILYLTQYKDNMLTVFILACVICSVLEYVTSYVMEKLFKTRWWDYSNRKFNLNGRICGMNSILFGLCGILVIYIVQPILIWLFSYFSNNAFLILTIIFLSIYITDTIISFNVVNRFKKTITYIDLKKDSTQEFSKMVLDVIKENHRVLQKRLFKAFPDIDLKKLAAIKEEITEELKDLLKK